MVKLLIITAMFPDKYNPNGEVFVQHQANELAKSFDVRVIATRLKRKLSIEEDNQKGYRLIYIYMPYIKHFFLSLVCSYRIFAIPRINRVIKEWKPDIIHVHDFKHVPELFQLSYYLRRYNIPRYLTVHNLRSHPSVIKRQCTRWFYRMTFRGAYTGWNHIFTVNDRIKEIIYGDAGVTQISNIGNAVGPVPEVPEAQIEQYRRLLTGTSFKIISVGNLKAEKGFEFLLESVGELKKKHIPIQVVIVGKGEEKENLTALVNSLGLTDSIIFTGDISNALVRNLYPLFDAFVLPSYSETFGVVYIEAMYAGLPAVGVKGQGIDGVIRDGINGFLVNPRDSDDLAGKIEYLINNREAVRTIAKQGQGLVRNEYQLSQLIKKIIKEYER